MFDKFTYTNKQIEKYLRSVKRDLDIASKSSFSEVQFRFAYDAIIKMAISVCAVNNLKIKLGKMI